MDERPAEEGAVPIEIGVVDAEEVVLEDSSTYPFEYDSSIQYSQEHNLLYELYQPEETAHGTLLCRICLRTGKEMEFTDKTVFATHRYKMHGSFNNNVLCPIDTCREHFASLSMVRRHLIVVHGLPLEMHQHWFDNIGDFENWRILVESSSGCRFVMHTKQPKAKRQMMHCARSEHKMVLHSSKNKFTRVHMAKQGACCPAHISFRIDSRTGGVHCFCQLFHVGHSSEEDPTTSSDLRARMPRPIDAHFPIKPRLFGDRTMQFLQIDVYEMPTTIYGSSIYDKILIVTDPKTEFMWAKVLSDGSQTIITRILTDIFCQFGLPEGFSTCLLTTVIRESIKAIENIFSMAIREVWNEPPIYEDLEQWLIASSTDEFGTDHRWVEVLQFVVMEYNQKAEEGHLSPFERMFKRKPPNLYGVEDTESNALREQQKAESEAFVPFGLNVSYEIGERVYLRQRRRKLGRDKHAAYLSGYISMIDRSTKYFRYKVHYSNSESPWPSETNVYAWVSVYDILPTTHRIMAIAEDERRQFISDLYCKCSGGAMSSKYDNSNEPVDKEITACPLFRNEHCTNKMSRTCCKIEGEASCIYHELYPENDDSYARLEMSFGSYSKLKEQEKEADRGHITETEEIVPERKDKANQITQSGRRQPQGPDQKQSEPIAKTPKIVDNNPPASRRSGRKPVRAKTYDDYVV